MQAYSTVSWLVSVPPRMEARLMFANLSQPKCSNRHTNIRVQRIGRPEEDYSRREDEEAESEITISESFYLNMSNCMPERGDFSVITKITLKKSISKRIFFLDLKTKKVVYLLQTAKIQKHVNSRAAPSGGGKIKSSERMSWFDLLHLQTSSNI